MSDKLPKSHLLETLLAHQQGDVHLNPLWMRWEPLDDSFSCPKCQSTMERTAGIFFPGTFSGSVRCTKCSYRDSVASFLCTSILRVEPLPDGALPIYSTSETTDNPDTK